MLRHKRLCKSSFYHQAYATAIMLFLLGIIIFPFKCEGNTQDVVGEGEYRVIRLTSDFFDLSNKEDELGGRYLSNNVDAVKFERAVLNFLNDSINSTYYEITPNILLLRNNQSVDDRELNVSERSFDNAILSGMYSFMKNHIVSFSFPSDTGNYETTRFFFSKGMKKFMWPFLFGLQLIKTALIVIFLPSIIGSLGKIVGKGLSQVSGTLGQHQTVEDLEFKDNYDNSELYGNDEYSYPPADSEAANSFASQMYDSAALNNALQRFGTKTVYPNFGTEQQLTFTSPSKGSSTTKKDDFKIFHDIPSSSLLLTNYDPFYSPLLSRLDAVFQQMSLGAGNESCREKLVCLMYANPAKYAPYSNLISAQLSRELNELKKPTIDNPEILRFFKYMKAAKDGQDGADCEILYIECSSFKDMSNPAMVATFNDINKLVQAARNLP